MRIRSREAGSCPRPGARGVPSVPGSGGRSRGGNAGPALTSHPPGERCWPRGLRGRCQTAPAPAPHPVPAPAREPPPAGGKTDPGMLPGASQPLPFSAAFRVSAAAPDRVRWSPQGHRCSPHSQRIRGTRYRHRPRGGRAPEPPAVPGCAPSPAAPRSRRRRPLSLSLPLFRPCPCPVPVSVPALVPVPARPGAAGRCWPRPLVPAAWPRGQHRGRTSPRSIENNLLKSRLYTGGRRGQRGPGPARLDGGTRGGQAARAPRGTDRRTCCPMYRVYTE